MFQRSFYKKQHVTQRCKKQELLGKLQSINEVLDEPLMLENKQLQLEQGELSITPAQPSIQRPPKFNKKRYKEFLLKKKEEITKRLKEHEQENSECKKELWQSLEQRNKYFQRLYYDFMVNRWDDDELETIQQTEDDHNNIINNT